MTKNEVKAQLERVCADLWWRSESDYPVEVVWQSDCTSPRQWVDHAEHHSEDPGGKNSAETNRPITTFTITEFFARQLAPQSWHTAEDKAQQSQLQQLKDVLEAGLSDLQVYRCGEVEVKVYILGLTPKGTLAGVTTTLVET